LTGLPLPVLSTEVPGNYITSAAWNVLVNAITFALNPPMFLARSNTGTSVPSGGISPYLTVPLETLVLDPYGGWNSSTNAWTVPVAGWYQIDGFENFAASSAGSRALAFSLNTSGSTMTGSETWTSGGPGLVSVRSSARVQLNAGDTIWMWTYQNSGNPLSLSSTGGVTAEFSARFIHA